MAYVVMASIVLTDIYDLCSYGLPPIPPCSESVELAFVNASGSSVFLHCDLAFDFFFISDTVNRIVMAYIVMAYKVMAYVVMAFIVVVPALRPSLRLLLHLRHSTPNSYGLYSHGLYSYGIYSYDLHSQ